MNKKSRRIFHLLILGTFLALTLFINFLHTDHSISSSKTCPACRFQGSTLTTSQINFFQIPQLFVLDSLKISEDSAGNQVFLVRPASRSPPLD
jgi:hypothetical protein